MVVSKFKPRQGFTLIELLIVVAIIGVLASVVLIAINPQRRMEEAHFSLAKEQLATIARASEVYLLNHGGQYPPDIDRDLPAGIMSELKGSSWPKAPWPGSVYDWDYIVDANNNYPEYVQISIRFCDVNGNNCHFPALEWAEDFDSNSAVYYCIKGPCKSHRSVSPTHPGYCINCNDEDN